MSYVSHCFQKNIIVPEKTLNSGEIEIILFVISNDHLFFLFYLLINLFLFLLLLFFNTKKKKVVEYIKF